MACQKYWLLKGVEVLRPHNIAGVIEQIFARDVGVVIDGVFIRSRTIDERSQEWKGCRAPFAKRALARFACGRAVGRW